MKIKNIALDSDENPETVTVEMTVAEAKTILGIFGKMYYEPKEVTEIYEALSGRFFNRFYEAGVDDPEVPGPNIKPEARMDGRLWFE